MAAERILLAKFAHETNTFVRATTDRRAFEDDEAYVGEALLEYFRHTETAVGGVLETAEREGIEVVPSIAASATPGGRVAREAYDHYVEHILEDARRHAATIDGVILVLHGAMVPEGGDDGEGPLVSGVRSAVGPDVPVVATLDLHGNVTDELVANADALVAYETHPHVDKFETGRRATLLLSERMAGATAPVMAVERPPVLPHSPLQNTTEGPMATVMERARELEHRERIRKVNVLPGFHRADVPAMGFSIPVVADGDVAAARAAARDLAAFVWERRESFVGEYPPPGAAVARAMDLAADADEPIVMGDFGPQPGGGGSADGTATLRAMIEAGLDDAGYAIMCDPAVVDACIDAGIGERVTVTVGGKTDDRHGDPIEDLTGYVKAITDGVYVNTGPSHAGRGTETRLGRTVLFQCGDDRGIDVILTERRAPPFDPEIWRHVGRPPERFDVVAVTSTTAFRSAYEPIAGGVVEVDSPGVASPIPERFEYERLRRPKFPIDEVPDDAYPDWD